MRLRTILIAAAGVIIAVPVGAVTAFAIVGPDRLRPLIERQVEAATGRKLQLAGPIGLAPSLRPTITLSDVTFANASWGSRPEMAKVGRVEVAMALLPLLHGAVEIDRLNLSDVDLLLETDHHGLGNWELQPVADGQGTTRDGPAGGDGSGGAPPYLAALDLERAKVTWRDGRGGAGHEVQVEKLTLSSTGPQSPLAVYGRLAIDGRPGSVEGSLPSVAGLTGAGGALPVALQVKAFGLDVSIKGRVSPPLNRGTADIALGVTADSLAGLQPLLGGATLSEGAFALMAHVKGGADALRLDDLQLTLGQSDLAGALQLTLAGRPRLEGNLRSRRLVLPSSPEEKGGSAGGQSPAGPGRLIPDKPLDLAGLKAADVHLDLAIDELQAGPLRAQAIRAKFALDGGNLVVEPLKATFAQSAASGRLAVDVRPATPALDLSLKAPGLAIGDILAMAGDPGRIESKGNLVVQLKGHGTSPAAIAGSLDGAVTLGMGPGYLRTGFLDRVAASLRGLSGLLTGGGGDDKRTALACAAFDLPVSRGVVDLRAVLVDTDISTITGSGTVNLGTEQLDVKLRPQAKLAVLSLPVGIAVTGSLARPAAGIDKEATARAAAGILGAVVFPPAALASLVDLGGADAGCIKAATQRSGEGVGDRARDAVKGLGQGLGEGLGKLLQGR